jgi:hypothetical protein
MSEYANGASGVLMAIAFVSLGLAMLALAPSLASDAPVRSHRLVRITVWAAGFGLLLSAAFRTGAAEAGSTSDAVHSVASSAATVAMVIAVVVSHRWVYACIAVALLLISPVTHGTLVGGLNQRLLWTTLLIWTAVAVRSHVSAVSATSSRIVS